ncbi:hypothetical protein GOP47_0001645 [Adiantum capillus-veneris]|uniref:Uncharacterized protein n=1 Tax=Adiantum capillus-veneris TaxID=13818 RepID=A0A9D4V986_ADICA|nr:hypothetical protein GOP47_0030679 [Adiantum capillus-veneris]KAI5081902.1 hypothetical protein GOP47_0001645 [Adiantum capillus-veneris]
MPLLFTFASLFQYGPSSFSSTHRQYILGIRHRSSKNWEEKCYSLGVPLRGGRNHQIGHPTVTRRKRRGGGASTGRREGVQRRRSELPANSTILLALTLLILYNHLCTGCNGNKKIEKLPHS